MASILTSIKKRLGMEESDTQFDEDVIASINTSFMRLNQLAVGPAEGFIITDKNDEWSDFLGERKDLEGVKSFVYLKARLEFDPPQVGFLVDAIKEQITNLEWVLNHQAEKGVT